MPGVNMDMAGFLQPYAQNMDMTSRPSGNFGSGMSILNAPVYDNLTPKGKPKDYKEGGQAVKFDTFHGTHDKLKALLFLQQFDGAFTGGNFTESSKILSSFKIVSLAEPIEKYCCGLPKGIKKYCTTTIVMNMAQLMENAEVADDLIQGKLNEDGFKTRRKEPQGKQFSAKGNVISRLMEMMEDSYVCESAEEDFHSEGPIELLTLDEVKQVLGEVRARNVKTFPVHDRCEWTDLMVVVTGISDRHVRGIADALVYKIKKKGIVESPLYPTIEGQIGGKWLVVDCGNIVIHVLDEESRAYYRLEDLWTGDVRPSTADEDFETMLNQAGLKDVVP
ncbi:hypothetical protein L7F22_061563 [Adiantum nelumboides]|nr:hypothetical protein [Adiantum nelumboides]